MREYKGWWLPDNESHIQQYIAEGLPYQGGTHGIAILASDRYNLAIDIGAHVGMWSWSLCNAFRQVMAFEPIPLYAECLAKNAPTAEIYHYALGNESGMISMAVPDDNTGAAYVSPEGLPVQCFRLDDFNLAPDFIKVDVEGYELWALQGAEKTLRKHYPAVCVECKRGPARYGLGQHDAVDYLISLGYDYAVAAHEDWIVKKRCFTR